MLHLNRGHRRSRRIRQQPQHARVRHQRHIRQVHNLADAVDVRIRLRMHQARISIARVAPYALRCHGILRITLQPQRNRKRVHAELTHVLLNRRHTRLIGQRRIRILLRVKRLRRIERAAIATGNRRRCSQVAVHMEQLLRARIVGLHVGIADRPCRRNPALLMHHPEVFRAHPEHRRAVHLRLATDVVGLLRMQRLTVLIVPRLLGVIAVVQKHSRRAPVQLLLRQKRPALQNQNAFTSPRQVQRQSSSTSSGTNDDRVVRISHAP